MTWESPLLEREAETSALQKAMHRVTDSRSGQVLLLEGEAGLGKTRLVRELRSAARDAGLRVLTARGSALETEYAFGVVRQLLERPARDRSGTSSALTETVRRVLDPTTSTASKADGDADGEVARLHGLFWLTADVATEPTLVVVDDAQWCDLESLRFLGYLQRRLDDLPVLLVLAVRSGEGELADALSTMTHDPEITVLRPAPLSGDGVASLLATLLGGPVPDPVAATAADVTAGNPFLLTVLARSLAREGLDPRSASTELVARLGGEAVQRQLRTQLERLAPGARALAAAGAALGGDADLAVVAEVAELEPVAAAESAGELATWGFADLDGGPSGRLRFRHAMVVDAMLSLLPERPRQELRRRGADVLEQHGGPPEHVAALVLATSPGLDPAAAGRLTAAADEALRRGAPGSALAYLERALAEELPPADRYALLVRAGRIALHTDLDTATRLLEEATANPLATNDAEPWADLGAAYGYLRDPDHAVHAVQHALRLVPAPDEDRRRELQASLLVAAVVAPGRADLTDGLDELRAQTPVDSPGGRQLDAVLSLHEAAVADPAAIERARRAFADDLLLEVANGEGPVVSGWLALSAADDPRALDSLDRAVALAQERGSVRALAAALTFRALVRLRAGRPADAGEDAREAFDHAQRGGVDLDPRFAGGYLAEALADLGDLDGAEAVLESVRGFDGSDAGPAYYARQVAARVRRERGRHAEARELALAAGRSWATYGFDNPAIGPWRSEAALATYALGDVEEAARLAEEELVLARRWGVPRALGRSLRVLGLVGGRPDLLEESVRVLDGGPARLELARSCAARGAALRRAGQRTLAREVLDRALELAQLCGATGLAAEVGAELRTAGYRPRVSPAGGVDALTLSERRVVDLAVAGLSNRSIAQELFVTPKTVELHLTNSYRKLGIGGRAQLADALTGPATATPDAG